MAEERKVYPQDIEGKINYAKELKDLGNDNFKNQLFKKAISNYSKGLAFTKGLPGRTEGLEGMSQMAMQNSGDAKITPELNAIVTDLDAVLKTNIATCYIKLNDFEKAIQYSKEALSLNPNSWKAMLRKAEAYMIMNDFEKAIVTLDEAETKATDEASKNTIVKTKEKAEKLRKAALEKQRKAFGGIFEKARAESGQDANSAYKRV